MAQTKANHRSKRMAELSLPDGLNAEELLDIYSTMVLVRTLDERAWALNRQGKAAIVASSQGHEAAQLASVWALRRFAKAHFCFTYYRDLGVCVAEGLTPAEVLLGFMGKAGEPISHARHFPLHGADLARNFMNLSNVVGTHIPHAVGWALAAKLWSEPIVTAVYFGDGATSQGDFHESMNFAAVHKLPVVFFCENNRYAISVPLEKQMAVEHVAQRAAAYGMPGVTCDGTDVAASFAAAAEAVRRAAEGGGPTLVELEVERYLPHTSDDDDSVYRPRDEVEAGKLRDPLRKLQEPLLGAGLMTEAQDAEYRERAKQEVNAATDAAEAAPYPDAGDVLEQVYAPPE